jgi:sugar-specific transcriptional regulator TrmB
MLENELEKSGLSSDEARTYLAALELGETTISRLAQKSGVNRSTMYFVMDSLIEKSLISKIRKGKKTFYFAEDPRKIKEIIKEKEEAIEKVMPQLLAFTNFIDRKPDIRYFEGAQGIKEVYKDTLKYPDQEICAWFSEAFLNFDEAFFYKHYIPHRINKKISVRAIFPDSAEMKKFASLDEKHLRRSKMVPKEKFSMPVEISLYGKRKIGIMAYEEQIGLIIDSPKIHEALKNIFELMWSGL